MKNIQEYEREVKSFLKSYNKLASKSYPGDEGIYDYDKLIESLSYVTKTLRRLERVQKKFVKNLSKRKWALFVTYDLNLKLSGSNMDSKIENIVGIDCAGSGAGFGERDIHFLLPNKEAAAEAKRKLKAKLKNKVRCEIAPK